jgi:hypothetical protein
MEDTINRENIHRLLGPYSDFRRRVTISALQVPERCRVDTEIGIVDANEGDYIFYNGAALNVLPQELFEEQFEQAFADPESPTEDELEDQTKQQ